VKAAAIVMYTEELIEDAVEDPTVLINNDVRAAFADYVDSNALGRNASGTIVGSFNSSCRRRRRPSSSARPVTRSRSRCRPRWRWSRATATSRRRDPRERRAGASA
jgi:hypothetical protein